MSGGFNPEDTDEGTTVELIDLGGIKPNCSQPTQLGFEIADSACLMTSGKNPLICGGIINETTVTNACFEYHEYGSWEEVDATMKVARNAPAYVEIMDGKFWILGGQEVC